MGIFEASFSQSRFSRQTSIFLKTAQSSSNCQVRAAFQAFSGCEEMGFQGSTAVFTDARNTDVVKLAETNFTQIISLTVRAVRVLQCSLAT